MLAKTVSEQNQQVCRFHRSIPDKSTSTRIVNFIVKTTLKIFMAYMLFLGAAVILFIIFPFQFDKHRNEQYSLLYF